MKKLFFLIIFIIVSTLNHLAQDSIPAKNKLCVKIPISLTDFTNANPSQHFFYSLESELGVSNEKSIGLNIGYLPYNKLSFMILDLFSTKERLSLNEKGSIINIEFLFRKYILSKKKNQLDGWFWGVKLGSDVIFIKDINNSKSNKVFFKTGLMAGWSFSYKKLKLDLIPLDFDILYHNKATVYIYNFSCNIGFKFIK
ncbi:MAG: hypothetical protein A2491_17875 [Bacteroidetes bacterium RIFOXYC12_FULL_35_7]|nr:MAG: hypothetical protein A2491_17875 [Bacteroidetes bacterium RIFOXYC12_FULL_35_7]